jgi:peptidyl-dipeptidase Dcp
MQMTDNPFFELWDTPFGLPPFERIAPEHFPAAFDRGMAEQAAEIAAIAGAATTANFVNTIEAL